MTEVVREAFCDSDAALCFPVMRQLRPELANAEAFADVWSLQAREGYRIFVLTVDGAAQAVAGFRPGRNIVHGRHLYVDDLVTDESARGKGYGAKLLERVREEARATGCGRLLLDTPMGNALGQRFYFREGMLATALRFTEILKPIS